MAKRWSQIIALVLVAVVAVSLWRAISAERKTRRLTVAYEQAKAILGEMEGEHTGLSGELTDTRAAMEGQTEKLNQMGEELKKVKGELEQAIAELKETNVELVGFQQESEQLRQQYAAMSDKVELLQAEKRAFETKFSSIRELKLAILKIRRGIRSKRWQEWREAWGISAEVRRARAQTLQEADRRELADGNHGYVVRDGSSTLAETREIQVHVLEPQSVR